MVEAGEGAEAVAEALAVVKALSLWQRMTKATMCVPAPSHLQPRMHYDALRDSRQASVPVVIHSS